MGGLEGVPVPRSLVWATHLDVLPLDRVIEQREGYLVVRSPNNPTHYWGNLLLFEEPPVAGDSDRWERLFTAELGGDARVRHRTFAWDRTDGLLSPAHDEFVARGYRLEDNVGLIADPSRLQTHPRANSQVVIRTLDPTVGADEQLWSAVVELQVAARDEKHEEDSHRAFSRAWLDAQRDLFRSGHGSWYVAIDPDGGDVAASCGVVVTGGRGRFRAVDTALAYRRQGIASRLVIEAGQQASREYGAESLVIVADAGYHAVALYESLGFKPQERVLGYCRWPTPTPIADRPLPGSAATLHPGLTAPW